MFLVKRLGFTEPTYLSNLWMNLRSHVKFLFGQQHLGFDKRASVATPFWRAVWQDPGESRFSAMSKVAILMLITL